MKNIIIYLATLVQIGFIYQPSLAQEARVGNGGGGIKREGEFLTFGSARVQLTPIESPLRDVPGVEMLIQEINGLPYLSKHDKGVLISHVFPTANRRYFNIEEKDLSEEAINELKRIYGETVNVDPDKIAIFAITSRGYKDTFILPNFYKLREMSEQAAIIWHESLWTMIPRMPYGEDYRFVIQTEMNMQAYIEKKTSDNLLKVMEDLSLILRNKALILSVLADFDIKNGHFKNVANSFGGISLESLYGETPSQTSLTMELLDLSNRAPNSLFLKRLIWDSVQLHLIRGYEARTVTNYDDGVLLNKRKLDEFKKCFTIPSRWYSDGELYEEHTGIHGGRLWLKLPLHSSSNEALSECSKLKQKRSTVKLGHNLGIILKDY